MDIDFSDNDVDMRDYFELKSYNTQRFSYTTGDDDVYFYTIRGGAITIRKTLAYNEGYIDAGKNANSNPMGPAYTNQEGLYHYYIK